MRVDDLAIEGLKLITPDIYKDDRGCFLESYGWTLSEITGVKFVQDNLSFSKEGVLRGLHLQKDPYAQGKLVQVIKGEVLDVVVDLRPVSKTFGQHVGLKLDEYKKQQFWIPPGFAHGFLSLAEEVVFMYKVTKPYNPDSELVIDWDDPQLNINWGIQNPIVSERDNAGISFLDYSNLCE